jgi:hypothetical protein
LSFAEGGAWAKMRTIRLRRRLTTPEGAKRRPF